jgi:hypothetical protein
MPFRDQGMTNGRTWSISPPNLIYGRPGNEQDARLLINAKKQERDTRGPTQCSTAPEK